jgi:hypothetical protein
MSFPDEPVQSSHPLSEVPHSKPILLTVMFCVMAGAVVSIVRDIYRAASRETFPIRPTQESIQREIPRTLKKSKSIPVSQQVVHYHRPSPKAITANRATKEITEWKFQGRILDVSSLSPIPHCEITFSDNLTDHRIHSRTDAKGNYRVMLPALKGRQYQVTISKAGYAPTAQASNSQEISRLTSAQRLRIAKDLRTTLSAEMVKIKSGDERVQIIDFFLAPR